MAPAGPHGGAVMTDRASAMRRTATAMLVLMAAIFAVSHWATGAYPQWATGLGYVNAFAEAAMVGGLADWFAVTALFRHPLGVPIPHTAIIPRKKDRIADTMAQFLRANFLTPSVVARRMRRMNVAASAGEFLVNREGGERSRFMGGGAELVAEVLESLDPERLGLRVRAGLASQLSKIELAPLLGNLLENLIADGRHRPLLDGLIRWAGLTLEDNEEAVREIIRNRANSVLRWTGLDSRISSSVLDGIYRLLAEVLVDPDHPMRGKIDAALIKLAVQLKTDPDMQAKVEAMKMDLLENPALADWWMGVWERMRRSLIARARDPESGLGNDLREALRELGKALQDDPRLQRQINRFARRTAVGMTSRYGAQIVALVSETVKRWDAGTVTDRIESAVGRDLQFIRINGTLVGGLVGVTLHAITQAF
jgi:uncharacterized membrane-anchored protein YjiN (DUF445 family)